MGNIRSEALFRLWNMLKANNIDIPYPHRDVTIRRAAARQA